MTLKALQQKLDTHFLYPLFRKLEKYFFANIVSHYGAEYKWGLYESHNLLPQHASHGYGLIHQAFIKNIQPDTILCVGSMYGYIPFMMAQACSEINHGHVEFVDAGLDHSNQDQNHFFGQGFWTKSRVRTHFSYLLPHHHKWLNTHIMTTSQYAKQFPKKKFEYIYLDGDRSYKGLLRDLKKFWPRLKPGGLISIHSIHLRLKEENTEFEAWKIWDTLQKSQLRIFEIEQGQGGIGFIQKKKNEPFPFALFQKHSP